MVCSSPERHGAMLGIMTLQIDWLSLDMGGVRPTQGKTLALMQVFDGLQSCKAVIQMRILGRQMRMVTIPNQSSIPKAFLEGDSDGRLSDAALYRWIIDVMEQLVTFTWLVRGRFAYLVDRYSERIETDAEALLRVVKL
jgi:arsenic resistance protein ArsH